MFVVNLTLFLRVGIIFTGFTERPLHLRGWVKPCAGADLAPIEFLVQIWVPVSVLI